MVNKPKECEDCPHRTTGKPEDCCQNLPTTAYEAFADEAKRKMLNGTLVVGEMVVAR